MRDKIRTGVHPPPPPWHPFPITKYFTIHKRYRINEYIRISPIRVVDENGENLGVIETAEALKTARERGLDLIEISPTANPPVCKIMDFGKFKYEREKGEREKGKGKNKESELKELRIGFTTGKHDLSRAAEKTKEFLERGDKVRISMRLRGREKAHGPLAMEKFREFLEYIPVAHRLESPPKRFPQGISAVIVKE